MKHVSSNIRNIESSPILRIYRELINSRSITIIRNYLNTRNLFVNGIFTIFNITSTSTNATKRQDCYHLRCSSSVDVTVTSMICVVCTRLSPIPNLAGSPLAAFHHPLLSPLSFLHGWMHVLLHNLATTSGL